VPARFRHFDRLCLRCARWDLSAIELVDERSHVSLARLWPLDKTRNADGRRRAIAQATEGSSDASPSGGIAPLLKDLLARYAATGLPPAYLPHREGEPKEQH
jgi:hypothetical protein